MTTVKEVLGVMNFKRDFSVRQGNTATNPAAKRKPEGNYQAKQTYGKYNI
jgi:hypothetical protein